MFGVEDRVLADPGDFPKSFGVALHPSVPTSPQEDLVQWLT